MWSWLCKLRQDVREFFFATETPYAMALMRIALPPVMLSMSLPRWEHTRELYSADGATAQLGLGYGYSNFMPEFSGEVAVALNTLMIASMLTMMVGWKTRASLIICTVLYPYFALLDAISTMTKYSVITTHLLLLLSCSHCGAVWSVDAWLARRRQPAPGVPPQFPVWPRRLAQILIGVVYFGAAITKINTPTFLSGDQLQLWMLTHINFRHPLGEVLSMYPVVIRSMAYVTIVWEMTFLFLVWKSMWRPVVLGIGIFFHCMTTLLLGLFVFPMTCFTAYLAFADEQDILKVRAFLRRILGTHARGLVTFSKTIRGRLVELTASSPGWRLPSQIAFPGLLVVLMAGGVGAEHWLDPYGTRRPEGPYELQPLAPEDAARLMSQTERIRDKDKFFAIDTGLYLVGDLLADRRRVFRPGDKMIAQCHLMPPHEDMWIECKILDGENRLIHRTGNIATREAFRLNFEYDITTATEPGEYTLVFETAGREVIRKKIEVVQ